MFDVYPTPAYTTEVIRIYRALDIEIAKPKLDEDEFLVGEWIDKEKVLKMINDGEINDSKTIIALLSSVNK